MQLHVLHITSVHAWHVLHCSTTSSGTTQCLVHELVPCAASKAAL